MLQLQQRLQGAFQSAQQQPLHSHAAMIRTFHSRHMELYFILKSKIEIEHGFLNFLKFF